MIENTNKTRVRNALKVLCAAVGLVAIQAVVAGRPSEAADALIRQHALVRPPEFGLSELIAFPNPAKLSMRFRYRLTGAADSVKIKIFDMQGRHIKTLDGGVGLGSQTVQWDLDNNEGRGVANGVYAVQVRTSGFGRDLRDNLRVAVQR